MTDQTTTETEQKPAEEAAKTETTQVEAPKPQEEAQKATITPEIQAIIDRATAEARKEGRESALKKLEADDSATKLKEATERLAKLEAHNASLERAAVVSEFGLTADLLDEFAPGLVGDALRAKAERLKALQPEKKAEDAAPAPKATYKNVQEAVDKVKAEAGTLDPLAAKIAAAAAKRGR